LNQLPKNLVLIVAIAIALGMPLGAL